MRIKREEKFRYVAGVFFALIVLDCLITMSKYNFYIWSFLQAIGIILVTVSCFIPPIKAVHIIQIIGFGLSALVYIHSLINEITFLSDNGYYYDNVGTALNVIFVVTFAIYWVLLLIGCLLKKYFKVLSLTAGIISAIGIILNIIYGIKQNNLKGSFSIYIVLMAVAAIMLSMSLERPISFAKEKRTKTPTEDKIDRLTKLSELLDKGIITNEDFEKQKKQIISDSEKEATFTQINKEATVNEKFNNADKLRELKSLLDEGVLTEEEFNAEKKKILNG